MATEDKKYDLEERTAQFAENIIDFCSKIPGTPISNPIVNQLIRSGTSIGANYAEANAASSKKDFKNKIHISKKESQETAYWLRMTERCSSDKTKIAQLKDECRQLILIFGRIV